MLVNIFQLMITDSLGLVGYKSLGALAKYALFIYLWF